MASAEIATPHRLTARADWQTRALCALFFLSGFPALIYQLSWQRSLFLIFGVNIESVTIVVTAFMVGLGLGSFAGGWLSSRTRIPVLALLALIEFATGIYGAMSLEIFDKAGHHTIGLSLPQTALISFALVVVPTLLMGATLPLLVEHVTRRSRNVGASVGSLYFVNTFGAGIACFVAAFALFPFLGLAGSVYVAVGMNFAVAAAAVGAQVLGLGTWQEGYDSAAVVPAARASSFSFRAVLILAAAGGFISLSYEIVLFRIAAFATGSSPAAFALMLGVFLIGIAFGSRETGEHCRKLGEAEALRQLVTGLLVAAGLGALFLPVLGAFAWLDRQILSLIAPAVFMIARAWGSLLPYLAAVTIPPDRRSGLRTAVLYLANIAGSASGSFLTGFVFMNQAGIGWIAAMLVVASVSLTLALNSSLSLPPAAKRRRVAIAVVIAFAAMAILPRQDHWALAKLQWRGAPYATPIAEIVENRNGIITVTDDGVVFGDGMYDGRFNTDLTHDTNGIIRPFALSLFHPAPRNVLMIGLSSGSWAQVIANNPFVKSLTVVEINPGYVALIKEHAEVRSLLTNPKVTIVTDDGRRWLRANPESHFDAVISNTTWHFRANVTNLLSTEFLDLVRHHLNPGGIVYYNTTESGRVQHTGCSVFPYGARFTNHMVLSDAPIAWDFVRWRQTLESYRIDGQPIFDLARKEDRAMLDQLVGWQADLTGANRAADRPIEACPDVLKRTSGLRLVTDDNMGSEWLHFLGLEY